MFILTSFFKYRPFSGFRTKMLQTTLGVAIIIMAVPMALSAQVKEDSLVIKNDSIISSLKAADTVKKSNERTPHGAAVRSAIFPGLGQAYNRKYWKMPIVYGALGATGAVFAYNIKYYKKIRFAYSVVVNNDVANIDKVAPELRPLVDAKDATSLRLNRNTFRKNIDYSVLVFLLFWGLNVVDATVDAHLKGFNVSDDLTLKVQPMLNNSYAGLGLVFDIHKGKKKLLTLGD